jgi:hypothetical protein
LRVVWSKARYSAFDLVEVASDVASNPKLVLARTSVLLLIPFPFVRITVPRSIIAPIVIKVCPVPIFSPLLHLSSFIHHEAVARQTKTHPSIKQISVAKSLCSQDQASRLENEPSIDLNFDSGKVIFKGMPFACFINWKIFPLANKNYLRTLN